MNNSKLVELQNKIHQQNVEMGWWDNPRPFTTFVCLFHSELSEAMEGDRKGLMDDHLPNYPMFQVELADFVIRCLDYLGFHEFNSYDGVFDFIVTEGMSNTELLAWLHHSVSMALDSDMGIDKVYIASAVNGCFAFSSDNDFDLNKIILEKVEYNKNRADHKRENRAKEGGKKY